MQEPHQLRFLHELVDSLNNQIRGSEVSSPPILSSWLVLGVPKDGLSQECSLL